MFSYVPATKSPLFITAKQYQLPDGCERVFLKTPVSEFHILMVESPEPLAKSPFGNKMSD